jgi:hypothetical protein
MEDMEDIMDNKYQGHMLCLTVIVLNVTEQVGIATKVRHAENVFAKNAVVADGMLKRIRHVKR